MKREALVAHFVAHDCRLEREGGNHSIWMNPASGAVQSNTFTERYGGLFGDTGGGVLIAPYRDWIIQTTSIPEPGTGLLLLLCAGMGLWRRRKMAAR